MPLNSELSKSIFHTRLPQQSPNEKRTKSYERSSPTIIPLHTPPAIRLNHTKKKKDNETIQHFPFKHFVQRKKKNSARDFPHAKFSLSYAFASAFDPLPASRTKEPWRKLVHAKHLETTLPLKNRNSLAAFATRTSARLIHTHTTHIITNARRTLSRCTDSYPRGQTTAHVRTYTPVRAGVCYIHTRLTPVRDARKDVCPHGCRGVESVRVRCSIRALARERHGCARALTRTQSAHVRVCTIPERSGE